MAVSNLTQLWQHVLASTTVGGGSIHGLHHWLRVERNGLYLAKRCGANEDIVRLFALFHDCRRENDGCDEHHGRRAAQYIESIRNKLLDLTDHEFDQLHYACQWHTDRHHTDDLTIGACWDADRLDLTRIGIQPRREYLNTTPAIELVDQRRLHELYDIPPRSIDVEDS